MDQPRTSPQHRATVTAVVDKFIRAFGPPSGRTPEALVDVYAEILSDLAPTDIEAGARLVLQTERHFPAPAILRRRALEMQQARFDATAPTLGSARDPDACPLCGAVGYWERTGVAPAVGTPGTPQYRAERPYTRVEPLHEKGCRLRHPGQRTEPAPRVRVYPLSSGEARADA